MLQLTLPYSNHCPPQSAQPTIDCSVPCPVPLNLRLPEGSILLGQSKASGASVPETTVNKHRHLMPQEGEVWPARDRQMPAPASYAGLPQNLGQPDLRIHISPVPDTGHEPRTLIF